MPDLTFTLTFETEEPGTHELQGDQLCGFTHAGLRGALIIETPGDFDAWLAATENQEP